MVHKIDWKRARVVYAISGLGKSTLVTRSDGRVCDADQLLYDAVAEGFPSMDPRERLRAWRVLCRSMPWVDGGEPLALWARVRLAWVNRFLAVVDDAEVQVVVTSLLQPPARVAVYYGVKRGRYLDHLGLAGVDADNSQSEAMNDRLEGFAPLVRIEPGTFLADRPELAHLIG